jgi:hypothetical protein
MKHSVATGGVIWLVVAIAGLGVMLEVVVTLRGR